LFIPTPDFNLETNYFTSELNINEAFIELSPISVDTSINYNNVSPDFVNLDKKLNEAIADKPKINYFDNLFSWVNKRREELKK
jgi:hypothetical protein